MVTLLFGKRTELSLKKKSHKKHLLLSKLIYTTIIIFSYTLMRKINLFGVDVAKVSHGAIDADMLLGQVVGGDLYKCSITAIGFAPYFIASIISMVIQAIRTSSSKSNTSPKAINRFKVFLMIVIAIIQAVLRSNDLVYIYTGEMEMLARFISILEMIVGSCLVLWLATRNKRYGVGAQLILILVNVFDGTLTTIYSARRDELLMPLFLGVVMMFIMVFMENSEKRIPVQRISIHNIYADKNYQALKFNPVGVFPVIFASAGFMLPQFIVKVIQMYRPEDEQIRWAVDNMVLSKPFGILVYIVIVYLINLLFSWIMINPKELTEGFLKSGDSIENLRPGKETKRYLGKNLLWRTFFSSTILSICLGISLILQMKGAFSSSTAMLPSSIMMLSGLGCAIFREGEAVNNTDSYSAFI